MEASNKLISDFMELEKYGETEFLHNGSICNLSSMRYNSSWDWLIPVLNKCRSRVIEIIDTKEITKEVMEMDLLINSCMNDRIISIENVFNNIVKFIKWQKA